MAEMRTAIDTHCGRQPAVTTFAERPVRLNIFEWGERGKPQLVMMHGWRDHGRSWDYFAAALAYRYHILVPELRGHGDSGWSADRAYASGDLLIDLHALMSRLTTAPVDIVAHSAGAETALRYAGLFPEKVRRLVAIEGFGMTPAMRKERAAKPIRSRLRQWIEAHEALALEGRSQRFTSIDEACHRFAEIHALFAEDLVRHLVHHGVVETAEGYRWKHDPALRLFPVLDLPLSELESVWQGIECPVLHMRGGKTWASDPFKDGQARHFRNARYREFEGAGHWPHHDCRKEVLDAIVEFLQ